MRTKILITGGLGHIGSYLINARSFLFLNLPIDFFCQKNFFVFQFTNRGYNGYNEF